MLPAILSTDYNRCSPVDYTTNRNCRYDRLILTEAFEQEYFIQLLYPIGRNAPLDLLQDPDISRELDSLRKPLENHLNSVLEQGEWPDDVRLMSSVIWSYLSGLGYKIVMGYPRDSLEAEVSFFVRGLTEYMHKESNHA